MSQRMSYVVREFVPETGIAVVVTDKKTIIDLEGCLKWAVEMGARLLIVADAVKRGSFPL